MEELHISRVRIEEVVEFCRYLAEARRAGRELPELHVLIVIGVFFLLRVHMVVPIRTG